MESHNLSLNLSSFSFFSFMLSLFLISYYMLSIRQVSRRCKCEICHGFLTGRWRNQFTNLPDWYAHLLRLSPTQTIHIHILNNTITANPRNVEHILRTRFDNYPKGKPMKSILGDFLGQGIFIVDGDHWRFQRKIASLELGSNSIRAYAHHVLAQEIRAHLLPALSTPSVDLQEVFRNFSFGNICRLSFGVDPVGLDELGLFDAFDVASGLSAERALQPSSTVWRLKRFFNLGSERRLKAAIQKVNIVAERIIKERREKGFNTKNDLLSRFMGTVTDDTYLRDIVVSFLLAGRDTVASGLTVLFYLLARHPESEARILEECNRVLGGPSGSVPNIASLEQLKEMHYLQAALYESLRLFPPVQIDSKWAQNDDVLPDGTRVKEGTRVSYHPYAMGRMEEIWGPDCLEFRPERWLTEDGLFKPVSLYKYPVFQAGVRVCLGKEVALMAMKTVALTLVQRFEIQLADPGWAPRFVPGLTATIKGGLPVVIRDRSYDDNHIQ